MREKVATVTKYLGIIRNSQFDSHPTKTYISMGVQSGRKIIYLKQYILSDIEYYGWQTVREFKGKFLQRDIITLRYETALAIMSMVCKNEKHFNRMIDYENDSNDSNTGG